MKKLICRIVKYLVDILNEVLTWCHTSIAAPTLLTATVVPPNIDLAWVDNASNNTCFKVWRSTDGTNFTLIDTIGDLENYTDTTATPGVQYWYRVQACDASGNTSDFSNTVETEVALTPIKYGILYNWYVATDVRGIAPTGWHLPSDAEWITLRTFLDPGGTNLVNVAGGKLKETGTTYWNAPNTGATNETFFNGRGAGVRSSADGSFLGLLNYTYIWASDSYSPADAGIVTLLYNNNTFRAGLWNTQKTNGCSIRLIKDDAVNTGSVVDYDGNVYETVKIGTQVWMKSNLIVKHYNEGTAIPEVTDDPTWIGLATGAWCYQDNDPIYM